jgi:orotate phosphoribosyltransferase
MLSTFLIWPISSSARKKSNGDTQELNSARTLRQLLLQRCFLTIDSLKPIPVNDAATAWLFYGCGLTLARDGLTVAADVLLSELARFRSTQIATYGLSALPLLGAMILRSSAPLRGLFVRKQAKTYGTRRLVEGNGDRSRPVVFLDESITLGTSAKRAIRALEEAGYEVEGVLALVDLSGHGTERYFPARGYTRRVVFDVYDDLGKLRKPPARPSVDSAAPSSSSRVPDGLSPADAVRFCAATIQAQGVVPSAPARLDATYDATGGLHVSVRAQESGRRVGHAVAPGVGGEGLSSAIVLTGAEAIRSALRADAELQRCVIAVTLIGSERPLDLRDLDHRRHVLILRGKEGSWRRASTLPNVEFFQSETGQIAHVRRKGRFMPAERWDSLCADVVRSVERGRRWSSYGAPPDGTDLKERRDLAQYVHARARYALARAAGHGLAEPPATAALLEPVYGVGVSLYADAVFGCHIAFGDCLSNCIDRATASAWSDGRFHTSHPHKLDDVNILLTLLYERRVLDKMPISQAARYVLLGRHSVGAYAGRKFSIVLAPYGVLGEYSAEQFLAIAAQKAKIPAESARWLTFETAAWLSTDDRVVALEGGFPRRPPAIAPSVASLRARLVRHCRYVSSALQADGLPVYAHEAETGKQAVDGAMARLLFARFALEEGRRSLEPSAAEAPSDFEDLLRALEAKRAARATSCDAASDAQLLIGLAALDCDAFFATLVPERIARLQRLVRPDGVIFDGRRIDADLDLLSGAILTALGALDRRGFPSLDVRQIGLIFEFARRRFGLVQPWGMTWWHAAGWYEWRHVLDTYRFVCELADFALSRQHRASGAFLTDYTEDPSFHTACVLEGIVAAWRYSLERGDEQRSQRYRDAWFEGQRFMETLTYGPGDNYFRRDIALDGGVRAMHTRANIRIDFVGHAITSLARGLRLLA